MILATSTSVGPHVFWITSRAAGTAALVLSSAAVCAGLLIGARGDRLKGFGGDSKALHEALSLATIVAIAVHGTALLGDHFLHPTLFDISVPFTGAYRPLWTGVGIVAGWGLAALGLSYYARGWVGQSRWRSLHRLTAVFWALGIVHTLGAGTDAGQLWFLILLAVTTAPAAILLAARLAARPEQPPRIRTSPQGQAVPAPVAARPGRP